MQHSFAPVHSEEHTDTNWVSCMIALSTTTPTLSVNMSFNDSVPTDLPGRNSFGSGGAITIHCHRRITLVQTVGTQVLRQTSSVIPNNAPTPAPRSAGLSDIQTCDRSKKDPGSGIYRIQHLGSWRTLDLIFSFSHGILEILDTVTATLPWDSRDLGSRTEKSFCWILGILDPARAGCCAILKIFDVTQQ